MKLKKELRKKLNHKILWDNIEINVKKISIDKDTAIAEVSEKYKYILDDYNNGFSSSEITYTINFQKFDNKWLISQLKSDDEFDAAYYDKDFDVNDLITQMTSNNQQSVSKDSYEKEMNYIKEKAKMALNPNLTTQWTNISYNRSSASSYAYCYSLSTSDPNSTQGYNPRFEAYIGNDCQNFASQCVWYGFGGIDEQYYIENKIFPMVASGNRAWYQTSTSTPSNWFWTGVDYFDDYIANGGYGIEGPYGWKNNYNVDYAEIGDIIQIYSGGEWGHTYYVYNVSGTYGSRSTSDIWICAHTANRCNEKLDSIVGTNESNLRTVRISGYYTP
jgi:hypothetical protein